MKTLVKIIRSSIKKNPDAGKTATRIYGPREITFEIKGEIPEYLKDEENCVVTTWSDNPKWCKGLLYNDDLVERLLSEKKSFITINDNKNISTVSHAPEPQYLYSYENTQIECNNCHNKIHVKEIIQDCNDDGCYDECPICSHVDTFRYRHENIEDVIKENPELAQ